MGLLRVGFQVIVDQSKLCSALGPSFALPVEISPFSHEHIMRQVAALPAAEGCSALLRRGSCANNNPQPEEPPAVTDNGNLIIDLVFDSEIPDVEALSTQVSLY